MKIDTRLSYSSATLLSNCSTKYWHYKVNKTSKDADVTDDYVHFNIGKAFHQVLEDTNHTQDNIKHRVNMSCDRYTVHEHQAMIHAMVLKYLKVHEASGLECIGCELEINNDIFVGFIDAIMKDEDGNWWIVDLKTAAFVTDLTFAKLTADTQLNLYASFKEDIASYYKLDPNKFAGARYRVTKKSKLKQKKTEEYNEFVKRIYDNIESYDAIIPVELMKPEEFYKKHKKLHDLSIELRTGEAAPRPNFSYCDAFFKSCEYFSQCHGGKTKTESVDSIEVLTWEKLK